MGLYILYCRTGGTLRCKIESWNRFGKASPDKLRTRGVPKNVAVCCEHEPLAALGSEPSQRAHACTLSALELEGDQNLAPAALWR